MASAFVNVWAECEARSISVTQMGVICGWTVATKSSDEAHCMSVRRSHQPGRIATTLVRNPPAAVILFTSDCTNLVVRNSNLLPVVVVVYSEHWCHFSSYLWPYLACHPNVSQICSIWSSPKSRHHDKIYTRMVNWGNFLKVSSHFFLGRDRCELRSLDLE